MINNVTEKVKQFLKETLEAKDPDADVKVIGVDKLDGDHGWIAEAEVVERSRLLPGYRVFEKNCYMVKMGNDLDVYSYKRIHNAEDRDKEWPGANF